MLSLYEAAHLRVDGETILDEVLTFTTTYLEPVATQFSSQLVAQWKTLDVKNKLPFVRDRVVELHFWVVGVYFEPGYGLARRILTKVIAMSSIIDDIYDTYGAIEELELSTTAIERALLDVYAEIEKDMASQGKLCSLDYAKEGVEQKRGHVASAVECHIKQSMVFQRKRLLNCFTNKS
ncbi:hypothetical protein Pint_04324 [Pistacia integerrima]|uniref:Uncharacterized protein n=1 Tax=Pistacia integerrima TaxID=434235 RepID=A0ACC0Z6G9_9ROSI|nr:hypothetical protein Pint_04324 [Pistacia integerrima]